MPYVDGEFAHREDGGNVHARLVAHGCANALSEICVRKSEGRPRGEQHDDGHLYAGRSYTHECRQRRSGRALRRQLGGHRRDGPIRTGQHVRQAPLHPQSPPIIQMPDVTGAVPPLG